jgi:hypothetical protein
LKLKVIQIHYRWEDCDNDLIAIAKRMSEIMRNMAKFLQGKGIIKSPKDLLNHANRLSSFGLQLKKCAKPVWAACDDSYLSQQLSAILERIDPLQVIYFVPR